MSLFGYGFGFSSGATPAPSGGLGGFDFASVGTIEMWLDARDTGTITIDEGAVSSWDNRIPAKPVTSVIQSTPANRPTLTSGALTGLDAIRFGGLTPTTSLTAGTSPVTSGPIYVYVLAEKASNGSGATTGLVGIYDSGLTTGYWDLNLNGGTPDAQPEFRVNGAIAIAPGDFTSGVEAHIAWGRKATSGSHDAGIDSGSNTALTTPLMPVTNATIIGDTVASGATAFQGDIVIVLVYSALTTMEHNSVIGGLAAIGSIP
jgi:hypothetical protein